MGLSGPLLFFAIASLTTGILVSVGFIDGTCKPTTVYAVYNAFQGPKQIIDRPRMGHESGPDIDYAFLSFLMYFEQI